eukprot:TRINITY_DN26070_c0_g1_i2.p1 TRINITY_DN26070_c0_g1~~TRINITY_DN26070_c0_g1_i2.p1  ORF type:complete len:2246 (-),score=402.18 TRINITY_DN26070_c0_g1_i2:72-6140(-)
MVSQPAEILAVGTDAQKVTLLCTESLEEVATLPMVCDVRGLSFYTSGRWLCAAGGHETTLGLTRAGDSEQQSVAVVWQVKDAERGFDRHGEAVFDGIVHAVAFAPSEKLLAVGGTNLEIAAITDAAGSKAVKRKASLRVVNSVRCLAWCPESRFLASGGEDSQITVWDVVAEVVAFQLPKIASFVCSVAISSDGCLLAYCSSGSVQVELVPVKEGHAAPAYVKTSVKAPGTGPVVGVVAISSDATVQPPAALVGAREASAASAGAPPAGVETCIRLGPSDDRSDDAAPKQASAAQSVASFKHSGKASASQSVGLLKHSDEVLSFAFSPDGKRLVAGGEDSRVVVWDVESQSRRHEFETQQAVAAVAFSPSGLFFAAGDVEAFVTVWCATTGDEVGQSGVDAEVMSIAMSSSPKEIMAVGSKSKNVLLMSVPRLEDLAKISFEADVRSLSFSPDGTMLAGGGGSDEAHGLLTHKRSDSGRNMKTVVWQLAPLALGADAQESCGCTFTCLVAKPWRDIVHAVAFAPSGRLLAVGSEDKMLTLIRPCGDFDNLAEYPTPAGVRCLSWSVDERFLVTGGEDNQVSMWDVEIGKIAFQLPKADDWYLNVAFSSNSEWLATCGYSTHGVMLHPIDFAKHAARSLHHGDCKAAKPSPPAVENQAITICEVSGIGLGSFRAGNADNSYDVDDRGSAPSSSCDIYAGTQVCESRLFELVKSKTREAAALKHADEVMSLAFGPVDVAGGGARRLVAGGEDSMVTLWDLDARTKLMEEEMSTAVCSVAYCPSGRYIAAGNIEAALSVWSVETHKEAGSASMGGRMHSLAIVARPHQLLAVGGADKKVTLLSMPALVQLTELAFGGTVRSLAFSPDGLTLSAGGGTDDTCGLMTNKVFSAAGEKAMRATIWRLVQNGQACNCSGSVDFPDIVHAVCFSPSGRFLAVGGENKKLSVLHAAMPRSLETFVEFNCLAGICCISWSLDSRYLASGGEDMQVTVWDVEHVSVAFQLPRGEDWICSVGFSPCGNWIGYCGFSSQEVKLVPVEMQAVANGGGASSRHACAEEQAEDLPNASSSRFELQTIPPSDFSGSRLSLDSNKEVASGIATLQTAGTCKFVIQRRVSDGSSDGAEDAPPVALPAITVGVVESSAPAQQPIILSQQKSLIPSIPEIASVGLTPPADTALLKSVGTWKFQPSANEQPTLPPSTPLIHVSDGGSAASSSSVKVSIPIAGSSTSVGTGNYEEDRIENQLVHSQQVAFAVPPTRDVNTGSAGSSSLSFGLPSGGGIAGSPGLVVPNNSRLQSAGTCKFAPLEHKHESASSQVPKCTTFDLPSVQEKSSIAPAITLGVPSIVCQSGLGVPADAAALQSAGTCKLSPLVQQSPPKISAGSPAASSTGSITISVPASVAPVAGLGVPCSPAALQSAGTCKFSPPAQTPQRPVAPTIASGVSTATPAISIGGPASSSTTHISISVPTGSNAASSSGLGLPANQASLQSAGTCKFDPIVPGPAHAAGPLVTSIHVPAATQMPVINVAAAGAQAGAGASCTAGRPAAASGAARGLALPFSTSALQSAGTCKFAASPTAIGAPAINVSGPESTLAAGTPAMTVGCSTSSMGAPPSITIGGPVTSTVASSSSSSAAWSSTPAVVVELPAPTEKSSQQLSGFNEEQGGTCSSTCGVTRLGGLPQECFDANDVAAELSICQELPVKLGRDSDVQINTLNFTSCGTRLLTCGEGKKSYIQLWDVETQRLIKEVSLMGTVGVSAFSPDGNLFALADSDGEVSLWCLSGPEGDGFEDSDRSHDHDGEVLTLAFIPATTGRHARLAVGGAKKKVTVLSLPELEVVATLTHGGTVRSLAASLDGCWLAAGGGTDDKCGLFTKKCDANSATHIWSCSAVEAHDFQCSFPSSDIVHIVAFSPTGKLLAIGGEAKEIAIVLAGDGGRFAMGASLTTSAGVRTLSWASTRFLAAAGEDMVITVWDVMLERLRVQLPRASDWYFNIAFSPNVCSWLASCLFDSSEVVLHRVKVIEAGEDGTHS